MTEEATTSDVVTNDLNTDVATTTEIKPIVVGEQSVYKSVEELIKGKAAADDYINTLKNSLKEHQELIESLKAKAAVTEQLKEIRKGNAMIENNTPNTENTNPQVSQDELERITLNILKGHQEKQLAEANVQECMSLVASKSEDVNLAIKNKAEELGVTEEYLKDIAGTKPQMFKSLFNMKDAVASLNTVGGGLTSAHVPHEEKGMMETLISEPKNAYNKEFMSTMITKALADPTVLGNTEWKL